MKSPLILAILIINLNLSFSVSKNINNCDKLKLTLQKHITKLEKVKDKKMMFNTYLSFAEKTITKIEKQCPDLDISGEKSKLQGYQNNNENNENDGKSSDSDYFKTIFTRLNYVYNKADLGADGAKGLKFFSTHKNLDDTKAIYGDFSKTDYLKKVEEAKLNGTYEDQRFFIDRTIESLNDYPRFIANSAPTFREYLGYLNNVGVKGDIQQELFHLNATKNFCEMLLRFAPNDTKATSWLNQVEKEIGRIGGNISYASNMHKKHLGKMLFSNKQVIIGNENEADFRTNFTSGDYIFATIFLPSKLRKLTDSYVINNMEIKVNGMMIDEGSRTAICVSTPMQERNYLQFAIVPDAKWKQEYGSIYLEHEMFTHESIARALVDAGPYSDISVDVRVIFRGTKSDVRGSFIIDQTAGTEQIASILSSEENNRYASAKLPKASMRNSDLEQQAMAIMRKKTNVNSGKEYKNAIIVSKDWDYDKAWTGVIVSRSLVMALTSKEFDGKCMYQLFTFFQQEKGNGTYSKTLEYGASGNNTYISCGNLD